MRCFKTMAPLAGVLLLAACDGFLTSSLVDQDPARQAVADSIHADLMEENPHYVNENGVKAMAACIAWENGQAAYVSGGNWYYYPSRYAYYGRPIRHLRTSVVARCQDLVDPESPTCDCTVVDENGRNAIEVP